MQVMLDSCVYLDIFNDDPIWCDWSMGVLEEFSDQGGIVINPVIYSEVSVGFARIEDLEDLLPRDIVQFAGIPREAAFLAGKCYAEYRKRGGTRTAPLPDFFIGAHASVAGLSLVTRDPRRFGNYFPRLHIISP